MLSLLSKQQQLQSLILSGCPITSPGLVPLTNAPALTALWLDHTRIDASAADTLPSIAQLSYLSLQGSSIPSATVAELRQRLPGCVIDFPISPLLLALETTRGDMPAALKRLGTVKTLSLIHI